MNSDIIMNELQDFDTLQTSMRTPQDRFHPGACSYDLAISTYRPQESLPDFISKFASITPHI